MYGQTPTAYYQQLAASGVRAQNAAAATFPYSLGTAAAQGYYGKIFLIFVHIGLTGSSYPAGYNLTDYAFNPQYYNNIRNGYSYGSLTGAAAYTVEFHFCLDTVNLRDLL